MKKLIAIAIFFVLISCEEKTANCASCIEGPAGEYDPDQVNLTFEAVIRTMENQQASIIDSVYIEGLGTLKLTSYFSPWITINQDQMDLLIFYTGEDKIEFSVTNKPSGLGGYIVRVQSENPGFVLSIEAAPEAIILGRCDDVIIC